MPHMDPELVQIVRAEAAAAAKMVARAEAKAQAKIRASELTDSINTIRKADAEDYDQLARAINKLGTMVDVLVDLVTEKDSLKNMGTPEGKRARFMSLCDSKAKSYASQKAKEAKEAATAG